MERENARSRGRCSLLWLHIAERKADNRLCLADVFHETGKVGRRPGCSPMAHAVPGVVLARVVPGVVTAHVVPGVVTVRTDGTSLRRSSRPCAAQRRRSPVSL